MPTRKKSRRHLEEELEQEPVAGPGPSSAHTPAPHAQVQAIQSTAGNAAVAHMFAVQRTVTSEELEEWATDYEQQQREGMVSEEYNYRIGEANAPVLQVSTITDAANARAKMEQIEGYRPQMQEGGRQGTVSGGQIESNEAAIGKLADYLVMVGEQGRTLTGFQEQVQQVRLDFGRVQGQMALLQTEGVVDPAETLRYQAEMLVGAATGARSAEESAAGIRGDAHAVVGQAKDAHQDLTGAGAAFGLAQREATSKVHALNTALSNMRSGIIPRGEDPGIAAKAQDLRGRVSKMQGMLSKGLSLLQYLGGAAGLGTAATQAATAAYGKKVTEMGTDALGNLSAEGIAQAISAEYYREETNAIAAEADQARSASGEAALTVNVSMVREAQTDLFSAMQTLEEKALDYRQKRESLRSTLDRLGTAANEAAGGTKSYDKIASLLGDVDVLVVQIDTTKNLGLTEQLAGGHATERREQIEGTRNARGEREGGVTYFEPYRDFQLGNWGRTGGLVWRGSEQRIRFITSERLAGSAYGGEAAANPQVAATLEQLDEMRAQIVAIRDVLSRSLGVTMAT